MLLDFEIPAVSRSGVSVTALDTARTTAVGGLTYTYTPTAATDSTLFRLLDEAPESLPALHIVRNLRTPLVEVLRDIDVIVKPDADDAENFVASFPLANLNASGDSVGDAIDNLRRVIVDRFLYFSVNVSSLGREPLRQLAVLRNFVGTPTRNASNNG